MVHAEINADSITKQGLQWQSQSAVEKHKEREGNPGPLLQEELSHQMCSPG